MANRKYQEGQSLIEILFAVSIGAILVGSAAILLSVALRTSLQNKYIQTASFLTQDLAEKVAVYAEAKWYCTSGSCGIYNLVKDGATHYSLTGTPFTYQQSDENPPLVIDAVTYTRYFLVYNVCRDTATGNITGVFPPSSCGGGQTEDPSTQQVTSVVSWQDQGGGSVKISRFLTRHADRVTVQNDWTLGATSPGDPVVNLGNTTNAFYDATHVDSLGEPGFIKITGS
jgi:type II secretory pathway pseudopilin PulG